MKFKVAQIDWMPPGRKQLAENGAPLALNFPPLQLFHHLKLYHRKCVSFQIESVLKQCQRHNGLVSVLLLPKTAKTAQATNY